MAMYSDPPRRRGGRLVNLNDPTSTTTRLLVPPMKPTGEKNPSRKNSKSSGTASNEKPTPLSVPPMKTMGNRKRLKSGTVSDRKFRVAAPTLSWSRVEDIAESLSCPDDTGLKSHRPTEGMVVQEGDEDLGDIRKARIKAKQVVGEFRAFINEYTGDHNDECEVCDEPGDLICCDFCNTVWHLKCLDFVNDVFEPTEKELWTCPLCTRDLIARRKASHLKRSIRAIEESTAEALKSGGTFGGAFCGVKAMSSTEWQAKVTQVKPAFNLGTFSTAEAAARAHDYKARCLVGDASVCNFQMDDAIDPEIRWESHLYEQGVGGKLLEGGPPPSKKVNGRGGEIEAEWVTIPGVCKTFDGWRSELKYGNRKIHLGFFPDVRRASAAYQRAKAFYFGLGIGGGKESGTISPTVLKDEKPLLGSVVKAVPYSSVSHGPLSEGGENIQGGGSSQKERDIDENLDTSSISDCTSQPVDQPPIKRRIVQVIGLEAAKELDKLKERMSDEELKALNRRERSMHGLYCEPAIGPLHQVDLESIPPCMDGEKERDVSYNDDMLLCGGPEELFVKVWDPEKGLMPDMIRFLESKPPVHALCAMNAANEVGYYVDIAEKAFSCAIEQSGQRYALPNSPSHTFEETKEETVNHYENKVGRRHSSCSHQPSLSCSRCRTAEKEEKTEGRISAMQKGKLGKGNNRCERNENGRRRSRQTRSADTLPSQVGTGKKLSSSVKLETSDENSLDSAKENISDESSTVVKTDNAAADSQGLRLNDVQKAFLCFRKPGRDLHALPGELGWSVTTTVSFYYNIWKKSPVYQWWKATRRPVDAVLTRTGIMLQNGATSKAHNDTIALRWRGKRLRTLMEQSNKI